MSEKEILKEILSLRNTTITPPTLQDMQITPAVIDAIYLWAKQIAEGGSLASYIPELALIDESKRAISIADLYNNHIDIGNGSETIISFQSVIKPFLYIYALENGLSPDTISFIEPTAQHFNADPILQPESHRNRPGHPLNNAGAISSAGAISDFNDFLLFMRNLTDNPQLQVIETIYKSEMENNSNNRAIAYRLVATGRFDSMQQGEKALEHYTRACAIGVTPNQVVKAALVLASGGIKRNKQIINPNHIVRTINVMNSYGLYENTGEISLLAAGARALSCKSGVIGLIMNVAPGRGAFCTYSPLLDKPGNSLFGKYALIPLNNLLAAPAAMRLSVDEILHCIHRL